MSQVVKLLGQFYERGEISLLELEFSRFLSKLENHDAGILAGAACVRQQQQGHLCLSVSDISDIAPYASLLNKLPDSNFETCSFIGNPGEIKPLILDSGNLYLQKYWKYENELAEWLHTRSEYTHQLRKEEIHFIESLFEKDGDAINYQKIAVFLSLLKDLIIISGAPGTGKTFTVQKIIEVFKYRDPEIRIGIAAPTGKAAQRLNDSINTELSKPAVTIHKLLEAKGTSGTFRYGIHQKLPYDLIIIDEASMLDINLWINLVRALDEQTKLILLGDKNQLYSVEAGSILGDICSEADNKFSQKIVNQIPDAYQSEGKDGLNDCIVELSRNYRFIENSGIQKLSEAINKQENEEVLSLLDEEKYPELQLYTPSNVTFEKIIIEFAANAFLENQSSSQILCAFRNGPFGTVTINEQAERIIKQQQSISQTQEWYKGRRIIITRNNMLLGLRNGETGVCTENIQTGEFELIFESKKKAVQVSRVQDYEPAWAITVHKSQGSEFDHVAIMLSDEVNMALSRELLYTAVTRARKSVLVVGRTSVISSSVQQSVVRRSGLKEKIWD